MNTTNKKKIRSEALDKRFDNGEDVSEYFNLKQIQVNNPVKRVNVDFTLNVLNQLDQEAQRIGVARTALIKMLIIQYLDSKRKQG